MFCRADFGGRFIEERTREHKDGTVALMYRFVCRITDKRVEGERMDNLTHCRRCRRLFMRVTRNVCPRCVQEIEQEFLLCYQYLRDHPGATVTEIHEGTGVSIKQIEEFVKEGRFQFASGSHLDYSCERCGRRIKQGRFCKECNRDLFQELSSVTEGATEEPAAPRPQGPTKGYVIWERRQQQLDD